MEGYVMKSPNRIVGVVSVALLALGAMAQEAPGGSTGKASPMRAGEATSQAGRIFVPESSKEKPGDAGLRAHTLYVLHSTDGNKPKGLSIPITQGVAGPLATTLEAETPQSLGCLYVANPVSPGCVPNYASGSGGPSAAGYGAIALVDAFDNPSAATDLAAFDSYWGLPAATFERGKIGRSVRVVKGID